MKTELNKQLQRIRACLIGFSLAWLSMPAFAEGPISEDKPFAEVHVIMQASQSDPARHTLVLDIANNLTKHYGGQDMADIEIIAFGPAVPLLYATDNANQARIRSLMEHGVRFYVCGTTLDTIERKQGKRPQLLEGVATVQTGVAFMLEEIARGYTHIHP